MNKQLPTQFDAQVTSVTVVINFLTTLCLQKRRILNLTCTPLDVMTIGTFFFVICAYVPSKYLHSLVKINCISFTYETFGPSPSTSSSSCFSYGKEQKQTQTKHECRRCSHFVKVCTKENKLLILPIICNYLHISDNIQFFFYKSQ